MRIYFLVNNSYQLYDAKIHLTKLKSFGLYVIVLEVPHTINQPDYKGFDEVYSFVRYKYESYIRSAYKAYLYCKEIENKIQPSVTDIIFFYTEFEPFNQLIVSRFKKNGAKVYLIEDGGFATYIPFCAVNSEKLSISEKIDEFKLTLIPGLSNLKYHKLNGILYRWIKDEYIDKVCLYRDVKIKRNLKSVLIKKNNKEKLICIDKSVIFLNEDMYNFFQSEKSYIKQLDLIIKSLCKGFQYVYFKYHPRETPEWRKKIKSIVLDKYSDVKIIDDDNAIEIIVGKYRPSVAASYFCAALFNLYEIGIEPLYLYHLMEDLCTQPVFKMTTLILSDLGYSFVSDFSGINSGYRSCLQSDELSDALEIQEFIINDQK